MITRLHSKYPELAQMILALPPVRLRLVVVAAARLALQNAGLEDSVSRDALAAINGNEVASSGVRDALVELQRHLDDRYLDAQDSSESQQELPAEALQSFFRARALAAVLGSIVEVDAAGAAEVVYEAIASSPNEDEVAETIRQRVR